MIKLLQRIWASILYWPKRIIKAIKIWWFMRKLIKEIKNIKTIEIPQKHYHDFDDK
jgi:hypothetical protein